MVRITSRARAEFAEQERQRKETEEREKREATELRRAIGCDNIALQVDTVLESGDRFGIIGNLNLDPREFADAVVSVVNKQPRITGLSFFKAGSDWYGNYKALITMG